MPGVTVKTAVRTGPVNAAGPASGQLIVAGIAKRGPTDRPVRVNSIADYEQHFGERTPYAGTLHDTLAMFFEEGGYAAQVARVVGPAAAVGVLMLQDRDGTPNDTLKIEAANAGAWSDGIKIEVKDGTDTGTYRIDVTLGGKTVESVDNLASPAAGAAAFTNSRWVHATDQGSQASGADANPAVLAATALSAGDDDRDNITGTDAVDTLDVFGDDVGPGAVALPGWSADTVGAGVIAHCKANDRIGLLSAGVADDADAVKLMAGTLATDGDHAGLFYPWVVMPDASGDRTIPPEGFVAAARARATADVGFWQVPAGDPSTARFVKGTADPVDQAANNDLADANVSGIVTIGGNTKLGGWFSLSTSKDFGLLSARDSLNVVTAQAKQTLEPYVWRTVDGRGLMLSEVDSSLRGYLQPIADRGGFFPRIDDDGNMLDPGYSVQVNQINTDVNLADNEVLVAMSIRLSPSAKEISVTITKAALGAAV